MDRDGRLETPEGFRDCFLTGLHREIEGREDPYFPTLYRWYEKDGIRKRELSGLLEAAFYENHRSGIGRETARALYGQVLSNSATRLEQFASCAFAHFLKYGLGLRERVRYEFSPADMGTVMHEALERFSRTLEAGELSWREISEEERKGWRTRSWRRSPEITEIPFCTAPAATLYQIHRIRRILQQHGLGPAAADPPGKL